jgi:hypothetical protein
MVSYYIWDRTQASIFEVLESTELGPCAGMAWNAVGLPVGWRGPWLNIRAWHLRGSVRDGSNTLSANELSGCSLLFPFCHRRFLNTAVGLHRLKTQILLISTGFFLRLQGLNFPQSNALPTHPATSSRTMNFSLNIRNQDGISGRLVQT